MCVRVWYELDEINGTISLLLTGPAIWGTFGGKRVKYHSGNICKLKGSVCHEDKSHLKLHRCRMQEYEFFIFSSWSSLIGLSHWLTICLLNTFEMRGSSSFLCHKFYFCIHLNISILWRTLMGTGRAGKHYDLYLFAKFIWRASNASLSFSKVNNMLVKT